MNIQHWTNPLVLPKYNEAYVKQNKPFPKSMQSVSMNCWTKSLEQSVGGQAMLQSNIRSMKIT